jgi:hydroxymethylbilane synthase
MRKTVMIGTRGSRLARIQSESVLEALAKIYQETEFGLKTIVTTGDKKKSAPVESLPGWGAFVKEIQEALLSRQIDIAVHSLKDLPVEEVPGLKIAAIVRRMDPRDVLVSRAGRLAELPGASIIGTGSPRRTAQLAAQRPDLNIQNVRGNIDTRLAKVERGEYDAIILAAAGLLRLGLGDKITEYLPLDLFLPEAGQAALAVEVRADDREIIKMLQPLNDSVTERCIRAERQLLKAMGGGCTLALGTLATIQGRVLRLKAMAPGPQGLLSAEGSGDAARPEEIAEKLAQKLFSLGAVRVEQNKL